jgi:hypothetical protein
MQNDVEGSGRRLNEVLWQNLHEETEYKPQNAARLTGLRRTLVDLQLDAQISYLFTCNTFIKTLYMFRALPRSSSGGLSRNCIYTASGIVTLCRGLSCAPVNRCTRQSTSESDNTRGCIYTITM